MRRRHCPKRSAGHSEFDRQRACRSDRRGREIEPGDNRTAPGKADRIEPKMAVQMNEPLADHIAKLGILGLAMESLALFEKPEAPAGT